MGFLRVNGVVISVPQDADVSIINGVVHVNGAPWKEGTLPNPTKIEVHGALINLRVDRGSVEVRGDISGNVDAGGSVVATSIKGHVDAGGSVKCANVGGNVDAGGSVQCGKVTGKVSAGGSIVGLR